jgi:hypothetical protein
MSSTPDQLETPADRSFKPKQRASAIVQTIFIGYSDMTRKIVAESPTAYRIIRRIFPLPWEHLLQERFINFQLCVRHALTDTEDMEFLIEIWCEANGM